MFHDAKPEWEWTNLLLPERTEWAATIRCVRSSSNGGRDGDFFYLFMAEDGEERQGKAFEQKVKETVVDTGKQIMGMNGGDGKRESE